MCWSFTAQSKPLGSCQVWSVYLTTHLLYCAHSFTRNWQLPFMNQQKGENDRRKYFTINLHRRMFPTGRGQTCNLLITSRSHWGGQRLLWPDNIDVQADLGFRSEVAKWIQSTLVISNSKGLSEILRDIRTSTYQICRTGQKLIRLTTFNKYIIMWLDSWS